MVSCCPGVNVFQPFGEVIFIRGAVVTSQSDLTSGTIGVSATVVVSAGTVVVISGRIGATGAGISSATGTAVVSSVGASV